MALGVYVTGRPAAGGLLRRHPPRAEILRRICAVAEEAVSDHLMRRMLRATCTSDYLTASWHPAAEPAEFFFDNEDQLVCSAQTSSAGPGYHTFLVELLEHMASVCDITWEWAGEGGEPADETGFHEHRDFGRLQREMAVWLQHVARVVAEQASEGFAGFGLALPADYPGVRDCFAISPLGVRSQEWFQRVAEADNQALESCAADFFPWWGRGHDAAFWRNCGLVLAWVRLPWRSPVTREERKDYEVALACFDRVRELDPSLQLPEPEIAEMQALLGTDEETTEPPTAGRIGFRRMMMAIPITGGWTIDLPGYYYTGSEDEGATQVFWWGSRTVRATAWSHEQVGDAEGLSEAIPEGGELPDTQVERVEMEKGQLKGCATVAPAEEDGHLYWMLTGRCATKGHFCLLTICYEDASDREWAASTWRSLSHPQASGPANGG